MGDRVKTGVVGLDERIGGGIPKGAMVLITGPTGSMKSTLAYSILHTNVATLARKALYVTLEQTAEELREQVRSIGIDPGASKDLAIVDLTDVRKDFRSEEESINWFDALSATLRRAHREHGLDFVAIDSLDALLTLADPAKPRQAVFHFFRELRGLGATCICIAELPRDSPAFSRTGIEEFLADGIVHLRVRELDRGQVTSVRRYLGVVKMRKTNHSPDYFPLILKDGKFEIVAD